MHIGDKEIGQGAPCFIVAEMSANHGQKYENAARLIQAARRAGADAIKVQTFTPDIHTIDSDKHWFRVGGKDNPESWQGETFHNLYQKAYMPWEWHAPLKEIASSQGIIFFSSPVDPTSVDFLEKLGVPCFKIASYDATDLELLKCVAKTGKPVILSTGFSSLEEIELSVSTLKENGARDLILLHCTTSYQDKADPAHTNLRTMIDLADRFNVCTGFSDNMGGIDAPILAAAMGASVIEKHLILEHDENITDDRFSIDESMFKRMVDTIRTNEIMMGKINYGCQTESEAYNKNFRRSLFVVTDLKKGDVLTRENVRSIRPGYGLAPRHLEKVLGKKAKRNIERGTPLNWDLFS